jgi:hypothetical protein
MKKNIVRFIVVSATLSFALVFAGCSSGSKPEAFFSALEKAYKSGNYETMLEMTASQSIEKFGREKILNLYKGDLAFFDDVSYSRTEKKDNYTIIIYEVEVWGRKGYMRIRTVSEEGKLKIVLNSLKKNWLRALQEGVSKWNIKNLRKQKEHKV